VVEQLRLIAVTWLLDLAIAVSPGVRNKGILAKHVQGYLMDAMREIR